MENRIVSKELASLRQEYDDILSMVDKYNLMVNDGMQQSASNYNKYNLAVYTNPSANNLKAYKYFMYRLAENLASTTDPSQRKHPFDYLSIGVIQARNDVNQFPKVDYRFLESVFPRVVWDHDYQSKALYWFNRVISDEIICRMSNKLVEIVDKDSESLKDLIVEVSDLGDHVDTYNEATIARLNSLESSLNALTDRVNTLTVENRILRDEIVRLNTHAGIQVEYNYEDIASRLDPIRGDLMHTQRIMIRNLRRREYSVIPMAIPVDSK